MTENQRIDVDKPPWDQSTFVGKHYQTFIDYNSEPTALQEGSDTLPGCRTP